MFALILKDLYNLKKQLRIMALFAVLYGALSAFTENLSFLFSILSVLCLMLPVSSFSFDQYAKWDNYALTLPVTRRQVILSKYCLMLSALTLITVACSAVQYIYVAFRLGNDSFEGHFYEFLIGLLSVCLLMNSIILPITVKLGAERARIATVFIFVGPVVLLTAASKMGIQLPDAASIEMILLLLPLAAMVVTVLSCIISIRIYEKKEF